VRRSGRPTFAPPGVPYYPALGAGQSLSWGYVTPRCALALAATYPSAAGAVSAAHGEAIVASLVDTLAWVTRGTGAVPDGLPLGGARPAGGAWARSAFGGRGLHSSPVRRGACWLSRTLPWGRLPRIRWGIRRRGGGAE